MRAGVAAQLHAVVGLLLAGVGQRQLVVAPLEAVDLEVAQVAQLLDDADHELGRQAEALGEADRGRAALEQRAAQREVVHQRQGDPQVVGVPRRPQIDLGHGEGPPGSGSGRGAVDPHARRR